MNQNEILCDFRNLSKAMLAFTNRGDRDQAGLSKYQALKLYKEMNLEEQERSLLWLEKKIAIYPEQIGPLLELISDLYQFHESERIFLSSSSLFLRTGLLLAARSDYRLS